LSSLTLPEIASFLNRLVREGRIAPEDYRLFKRVILKDLAQAEIHGVTEPILLGTVEVHERCRVRTLDAIHLATARHAGCDLFVTGDKRQIEAAALMGLKAELTG
jgi:predicted nucleic acid-binding protein